MMEKLSSIDIPEWVINLVSLIAGIATIATFVVSLIPLGLDFGKENIKLFEEKSIIILLVCPCLFSIIMFLRVKKYRKLMMESRKIISEGTYKFLHDFRNLYFYLLTSHKKQQDSIQSLTIAVEKYIEESLDQLCDILSSFTKRKICASVKIIESSRGDINMEEGIDLDDATVKTFARSKNTDLRRKSNDISHIGPKLKDNTDFLDIVDPKRKNKNSYFYQRDLIQYDKELKKVGEKYRNTTEDWDKYYRGTIVAPIRIANKYLHYTQENEYYDIVGFVCVDSLSTWAFLANQENYNRALVKAFAAEMYVIFSKYRYYLKKIQERSIS